MNNERASRFVQRREGLDVPTSICATCFKTIGLCRTSKELYSAENAHVCQISKPSFSLSQIRLLLGIRTVSRG